MRNCLILLLLIIPFLFSCGKKKQPVHTIVQGKVINYGSKAPIEGVEVILQDGVEAGGLIDIGGTSSDKKNISFTDSNGAFKVELKGEHLAYIGFKKEGYSFEYKDGGAVIGIKPYSEGIHENEIFEMKARSYFDGIFKNKYGETSDSLFVKILTYNKHKQEYQENGLKRNCYGKETCNFSIPLLAVGDTYFVFKLDYTRNGQWESKIDSVFIKSFETYRDTIYY